MDITLDPSLDSDNYKKSWNNNPNKSSNKNSNKNKKDTRETLYSHDHYTDNSQAPKAAVSAYNFVPFTRTVLASPLDAMKHDFAATLKVKRRTAVLWHWKFPV